MPFDPLYLIISLPALLLAMGAQFLVKSTFSRYQKVRAASGLTGAQAAMAMLAGVGITDCRLERVNGTLTDHYDPSQKVLRLSPDVYDGQSLSAIGVACHEAGHAIQHAQAYAWLGLRTAFVPIVNFSNKACYLLMVLGMLLSVPLLVNLGMLLFCAAVLFSIITLPVEWDASRRAKQLVVSQGLVSPAEVGGMGSVLNAAFMTYICAVIQSLSTLLYYFIRSRSRR